MSSERQTSGKFSLFGLRYARANEPTGRVAPKVSNLKIPALPFFTCFSSDWPLIGHTMHNFRLSANNCQLVHLSGGPPCGAALFKRRGSRPSEAPAGRLNVFSSDVLRVRRKSTFYANQEAPSSSSSVSHKSHRGDFEATNPSRAVLRVIRIRRKS